MGTRWARPLTGAFGAGAGSGFRGPVWQLGGPLDAAQGSNRHPQAAVHELQTTIGDITDTVRALRLRLPDLQELVRTFLQPGRELREVAPAPCLRLCHLKFTS